MVRVNRPAHLHYDHVAALLLVDRNGVMHGYQLAVEGSEDDYQKCVSRLTSEINAGRCAAKTAQAAVVMPDLVPTFEAWWEEHGQYHRAGGGDYEKTFAYRAYENALVEVARLNQIKQ